MLSINTFFYTCDVRLVCICENQKKNFYESFSIEMEEQAVDLADCIAVEDSIENNSSGNSLWKFCNSVILSRSEVLFFKPRRHYSS